MSLDSDIVSPTPQTLEEAFLLPFCICGHLKDEHSFGECKSLNYNGAVWYGCGCRKLRIGFQFVFEPSEFMGEENGPNPISKTRRKAN